jgi:hypothetical protein
MPNRIRTTNRPYVLTFLVTGQSYRLTSEEAQRLLDTYFIVKQTRTHVVLMGDQRMILQSATLDGGEAFVTEVSK